MFCLGPKHPKQDFSSHGSHVGFVWEPGIWQVHADAGQAVGRGPGATAAGVAAHTEVHLGSRTSPADLGIGGCLRLTNVVQHGEKLGFGS
jgi:hypothetical protein